jgi:Rrf2 family transcriptional regulator, cysteine metabolism repressor
VARARDVSGGSADPRVDSVMRLSTTDVYALHALAYLAVQPAGGWSSNGTIAAATGVGRPYLARLLAALVAADLVASKKGVGGGFRLARPADVIDLRTVFRAIDGPIAPLSCVSLNWFAPCPEQARCHARTAVHQRVRDAMLEALSQVTVADLAVDQARGVDYRHCLDHVLAPA